MGTSPGAVVLSGGSNQTVCSTLQNAATTDRVLMVYSLMTMALMHHLIILKHARSLKHLTQRAFGRSTKLVG